MVVESCVVYKAIYNYSFLDKELLHSWCVYTDNEGAMCLSSVSLASLWRPLYPLIVLIICLAYVFLLELLDLGDFKTWYKAFYLFYYFLYSHYVIRLASCLYYKANGDR